MSQRFARDPTSARRSCPEPGTVRDRARNFAALPLYSPDLPCVSYLSSVEKQNIGLHFVALESSSSIFGGPKVLITTGPHK